MLAVEIDCRGGVELEALRDEPEVEQQEAVVEEEVEISPEC